MKRPIFFISSTIFDFCDLRSAIKYELEIQGNVVLASEFNDFKKPLDLHSYEACLASIEQCDYFILLIGSRVGGWYDKANRISITQKEYRKAYELHKTGRLKIVSFVRQEVWQVRESRKDLLKYLQGLSLPELVKRGIATHPTKLVEDAEFISGFIEEVGRNQETRTAVMSGGPLPTGNWIHVFSEFRHVMDVLRALLFAGLPVEDAAYREVLQQELIAILQSVLLRTKGGVISPRRGVEQFAKAFPLQAGVRMSAVKVSVGEWDTFCSLMVHIHGKQLHAVVLRDALTSPTFLEFDVGSAMFRETVPFGMIAKLVDEIRSFNRSNSSETLSIIFADAPKHRSPTVNELHLDSTKLANLVSLAYRWTNIVDLTMNLIRVLRGRPMLPTDLMPFSPIVGMDPQIQAERVTRDEAIAFAEEQP